MAPVADIESRISGTTSLVGVGVGDDLLPDVIAARRRTDGGVWRLLCPSETVDRLGRSFVLGTAVAEADSTETVAINAADSTAGLRSLFVTDEAIHAVAGPEGDRSVLTETDPDVIEGVRAATNARFERGASTTVRMPSRTRLLETARTELGSRFADDLAGVLESIGFGDLDRSRAVDDRALLVALGARHDLLFFEVRTWADDAGIAPRQHFTEPRRSLVDRGIIESVKVPLGVGHPNYRLRAVDAELIDVSPDELVPYLRDRFDGEPGAGGTVGPNGRHGDDTPVWNRNR